MASDRRIEETKQTFSAPTYRVAGDPASVGFNTREAAEARAAQLDDIDVITDIIRNPNR